MISRSGDVLNRICNRAEPEAVASAAAPPSSAAILFSNTSEVGFINRV